jgi:hypothetical protein
MTLAGLAPGGADGGPTSSPPPAELKSRIDVLDQEAKKALKSKDIGTAVSLYVQMIDLGSEKGLAGICDIQDHYSYYPENGSLPCVVAGVRLDKVQKALAKKEVDRQNALREEAKRQEAARQEESRQKAARDEAARQEAALKEAARQDAARQKAAADEAARQDAAQREEQAREEAAKRQADFVEAIRRAAHVLEIRKCREHCESLQTHCDGPVEQAICKNKINACEADCS